MTDDEIYQTWQSLAHDDRPIFEAALDAPTRQRLKERTSPALRYINQTYGRGTPAPSSGTAAERYIKAKYTPQEPKQ